MTLRNRIKFSAIVLILMCVAAVVTNLVFPLLNTRDDAALYTAVLILLTLFLCVPALLGVAWIRLSSPSSKEKS